MAANQKIITIAWNNESHNVKIVHTFLKREVPSLFSSAHLCRLKVLNDTDAERWVFGAFIAKKILAKYFCLNSVYTTVVAGILWKPNG